MYENQFYTEEITSQPAPVIAKKGLATASLVFGILALLTTFFFINYIFGILSLILGIIYLVKKADVKPKKKAIAGIVCTGISLLVSTILWISLFVYMTKTDFVTIIEDVGTLTGEEVDGQEIVNEMIVELTGASIDLNTVEAFIGGELSLDRWLSFIDGSTEEEILEFIYTLQNIGTERLEMAFPNGITYDSLEAVLGANFTLQDIMNHIETIVGPIK